MYCPLESAPADRQPVIAQGGGCKSLAISKSGNGELTITLLFASRPVALTIFAERQLLVDMVAEVCVLAHGSAYEILTWL